MESIREIKSSSNSSIEEDLVKKRRVKGKTAKIKNPNKCPLKAKLYHFYLNNFLRNLDAKPNFQIDEAIYHKIVIEKLKIGKKVLDIEEFKELMKGSFKLEEKLNWKEKYKWSNNENLAFVWLILAYSSYKEKPTSKFTIEDWECLSEMIPGTSSTKLRIKWSNMQESKAQNHGWQEGELLLLKEIVTQQQEQQGVIKWAKIAEIFNEQSQFGVVRLAKHCREKWNNHLNPEIKKGDWTEEEDLMILEETLLLGGKPSYAGLAKRMKNRNENTIKNRFLTLIGFHAQSRKKNPFIFENFRTYIETTVFELRKRLDEKYENRILEKINLQMTHCESKDNIFELNTIKEESTPKETFASTKLIFSEGNMEMVKNRKRRRKNHRVATSHKIEQPISFESCVLPSNDKISEASQQRKNLQEYNREATFQSLDNNPNQGLAHMSFKNSDNVNRQEGSGGGVGGFPVFNINNYYENFYGNGLFGHPGCNCNPFQYINDNFFLNYCQAMCFPPMNFIPPVHPSPFSFGTPSVESEGQKKQTLTEKNIEKKLENSENRSSVFDKKIKTSRFKERKKTEEEKDRKMEEEKEKEFSGNSGNISSLGKQRQQSSDMSIFSLK